MHKLFSRISLLCLLSLAYTTHVVALDDLFAFPSYGQIDPYDDGSGIGKYSDDDDDDYNDGLGFTPKVQDDDFKSPSSSPEHNQSPKAPISPTKRDDVIKDAVIELNNTDQNMFVRWWQESTSGQIWGLAGMVAILGYGMHQLYAWYKKCNATLPTITEYDYEVAKTLLDAMHDDMKQLKDGNKKLPRVNLVDLSKMTPKFAAECQMLVAVFMNIYKTCLEDAKNMAILETFYSNVADAINSLEERVKQSEENQTSIVTNEDEA